MFFHNEIHSSRARAIEEPIGMAYRLLKIVEPFDNRKARNMKKIVAECLPLKLSKECNAYDENIASIRKKAGKHVLIHGSTIVDFFPSYAKALEAGYEMYGTKPFMVREVNAKDAPTTVLRFSFRTISGPLRLQKGKRRP